MQRRQFLGSTAAVGGAALAGRVESENDDVESENVDVETTDGPASPSVPVADAPSDWAVEETRTGTFTDSTMGVRSTGTTITYVDQGLDERLREQSGGTAFDGLRTLFATRIEYSPPIDKLPFGIGRNVVVNGTKANAQDRFERWLEAAGLEGIEPRGKRRIDIRDGPTTQLTGYDAAYPYEGFEFEAEDAAVSVTGDPVSVEGLLAVWYDRDPGSTFVAGAVNPAETYERTIERRLTDAVDLTLEVDLGLTPVADREESLEVIRSIT